MDGGSGTHSGTAFLDTIAADSYLLNLDWKEFARHYNGSGYAQNQYDKRLEKAYAKYK